MLPDSSGLATFTCLHALIKRVKLLTVKRTLKASFLSRKQRESESLAEVRFVTVSCRLVSQSNYLNNSNKNWGNYSEISRALKKWGKTLDYVLCFPYTSFVLYHFLRALQQNITQSRLLYLLNIVKLSTCVLRTCVLAHKIFNKSSNIPLLFHDSLRAVSSLHKYNTRYASKGNFHRPKVRTNTGNFTFVYAASKLWETLSTNLKRLFIDNFKKRYKNHSLKCESWF